MSDIEEAITEAAVIASIQRQADGEAHVPIEDGNVYLVPDGDGRLAVVDTDSYAPHPRHVSGSRTVTDAASFVAYVNRHRLDGTEVYAHTNTSTVVAVIDSHEGTDGEPGWQKHKLTLELEKSKPWLAWEAADGHLFDQQEFAEFLDDRYIDVVEPEPALLIDIATTFQAKTGVEFDSGVRLDSGDVKLTFKETTTAKAGQKGDIEIPKKIRLALRPYIGGPIYAIWANFRYRLRGGQVLLGFKLERPENVLDAAFADIVTEIQTGRTENLPGPDGALVETRVHDGIGDVPLFRGKP